MNEQVHKHTHTYKHDNKYYEHQDLKRFYAPRIKPLAATCYLIICLFDFIIAPIWHEQTQEDYLSMLKAMKGLDPSVQQIIVAKERMMWQPITLMGGALFHISFGAILTGVAVIGHRGIHNTPGVISPNRNDIKSKGNR